MAATVIGVEIGCSRITAMVGHCLAPNEVAIRGFGQAPSYGVDRGRISDPEAVVEQLRAALGPIWELTGGERRQVYLSFSAPHLYGVTISDRFTLRGNHVSQDFLNRSYAKLYDRRVGSRERLLHQSRKGQRVDGAWVEPDDLLESAGKKLDLEAYRIVGRMHELEAYYRLFDSFNLGVEKLVFGAVGAGRCCVPVERRESSALMIDIGAGVTNYLLFARGVIWEAGVLKVAGDDLSGQIAAANSFGIGAAERIKEEVCRQIPLSRARAEPELIDRFEAPETFDYEFDLRQVTRIAQAHYLKLFRSIYDRLPINELGPNPLEGGIYICGGGANVNEIEDLAASEFGVDAFCVSNRFYGRSEERPLKPELAAISGLLEYAAARELARSPL